MVKQIAAAFALAVASAMVVTAASAEVFASPDGAFTVEFPAGPKLAKSQGRTDAGTAYAETRWSVRNKDGYWAVAMFAYAKPRKADIEANVRAAVAAAKGRLANASCGSPGISISSSTPATALRPPPPTSMSSLCPLRPPDD